MKLCQRLLPLLLCVMMALPVFASSKEATISLSRDPEPPFCAVPGQTSVEIHWEISYATTPNRVKYFLQDPTRLINLEQEVYLGATGVNITRYWPVPAGSVDGKYWIRVEYWSFEAGNEANAEVTFYVCNETGTICATKLADSNCNGVVDPGIDQPVPGWWICLTTPFGDDYCLQTGLDGQVCWTGIPLGDYYVYEAPVAGWVPIGPSSYFVSLVDGTPQSFTFLNQNTAACYHACCLPDGSCVVLMEVECVAQGGIWQASPTCDGVACPQPPGACCFPDGSCQFVTNEACLALGGVWYGYGSVCDPNPCPPPYGSCCYPDGSCAVTLQVDCTGIWTMFGVCEPNTCEQPPVGACCDHATGDCTITTQAACGFEWLGPDVPCNTETCPPPGACCDFVTGNCTITVQADCAFTWLGAGVPCNTEVCPVPPPTGACCDHATGDCVVTTQADCPFEWLGADVPCNTETCPPPIPTGACCDPATGNCTITTQADCGFAWLGPDVPCNTETCPVPTGACCDHATGDCTITTQADCAFDWLGVDVPCNLETCVPPVPTERTSWGQIKNIYR